jgi:hypothetical protein
MNEETPKTADGKEITPETFPQYQPHALIASLPDYLKDHANYDKVQRALLDAGATRHSHSDILEWSACGSCQRKQWDRKEMMYGLGFKSGAQYMAWKKIHETIKKRVPLPKYNK